MVPLPEGFEMVDSAMEILSQPPEAQQAFADAVSAHSATCLNEQESCEDQEANGQQACAECYVEHLKQKVALCTCGRYGGPKRSSEGLCPVDGNDLPIVAKDRRELRAAVNQYRKGLAILAHALAGSYDGQGSGPTFPHFWLVRALGEDYDRSILEEYTPPTPRVRVFQTCTSCHQSFPIPPDEDNPSSHTCSPNPICPTCMGQQG